MFSLLSTVEEERRSQHKETQHSNFKRFNFSAHGPAMDERQLLSQTGEFSKAEGFLRGSCIIL